MTDGYSNFDTFGSSTPKPKDSSKTRFKLPKIRFPKLFKGGFFSFARDLSSNKEIRNKILVTIFIIVIYRVLAQIPLPGINMQVYQELFANQSSSEINYLLTIFTGGRLDSPSIIGLGLAAYINASVIMQILPYGFQRLKQLQQEGERGRQIINQITRFLTLPLSFVYSIAYILWISQTDFKTGNVGSQADGGLYLISAADGSQWPSVAKVLFMALILAAGTLFLMWLSEIITEKGIGNGTSLIISLGIIAGLPALLSRDLQVLNLPLLGQQIAGGNPGALLSPTSLAVIGTFIGFIFVIAAIVFINEAQRNLPIQYARRVRGDESGQGSSLPIKFTITGVMPVIFAYGVLSIPQILVTIGERVVGNTEFITALKNSFIYAQVGTEAQITDSKDFVFEIVYFLLIIAFGVFYSYLVMNPKETAENLQKSGAFIPGIRPGKSTENYVSSILLKIALFGSFILAIIAVIPFIGRILIESSAGVQISVLTGIGGTSILILVGVLLDTRRQYQSMKASRNYQRFVSTT